MDLPAAVLWDMDGTIVDTEPYWIAAEHRLVERYGGTWSHEYAHQLVGLPLMTAAAFIREHSPISLSESEIVNELQTMVIAEFVNHIPWRPGAQELLGELVSLGVPNALVTMSWQVFADELVAALPPGTFSVVVTGDRVSNGKPHPEPYLTAAAELGVAVGDCVAIEDSPTGVRSAVAARVPTIAVPNTVTVPPIDGAASLPTLVGVRAGDLRAAAGTALAV